MNLEVKNFQCIDNQPYICQINYGTSFNNNVAWRKSLCLKSDCRDFPHFPNTKKSQSSHHKIQKLTLFECFSAPVTACSSGNEAIESQGVTVVDFLGKKVARFSSASYST